ncbi:MAG: type II toxin-antitoxin system prevent-host-death family antitoxin [Candidatus Gracilibacteria bacterium]|nr:type II toxin-antitoxin system prevent-host-death family antitoxin [Candidatus Gracilibacteria bacterium]
MRSEQCISVTELAKNTSGIIRRANASGVQYVFVNNKPQAVILSMQEYEALENAKVEFGTVDPKELSAETLAMYHHAKTLPKESFIDL